MLIKLNTIKDVQEFNTFCSRYFTEEIDLRQGRYVVDAKSIMGIFSLNLLEPVEVIIHTIEKDSDSEHALRVFLDEERLSVY